MLFVKTELELKDINRIKLLNKDNNLLKWIIFFPVMIIGIIILLAVIFFQITNIINIKVIPRIPGLGIILAMDLFIIGSGGGILYDILNNPIAMYLKKPDDFIFLKAKIVKIEGIKSLKKIKIFINYWKTNGDSDGFYEKIKIKYWDKKATLPLDAWIVYNIKQTGDKGLIGIIKF